MNMTTNTTNDLHLIDCSAPDCRVKGFVLVPSREFPTLCLDCADDASRKAHGWTPENSTN